MFFQHIEFQIEGLPPGMMQHNGRLANKLDPFAKELSALTGKSKKTDADFAEIAKLEWYAGLYTDKAIYPFMPTGDARVMVTSEWLEGMLAEAASLHKQKKQFKRSILVPQDAFLTYDGPDNIDALWAQQRHLDVRSVKISGRRIMRARPHFAAWSLTFQVAFKPEMLNAQQVSDMLVFAGKFIGLSDYRPKYGLFTVISHKLVG